MVLDFERVKLRNIMNIILEYSGGGRSRFSSERRGAFPTALSGGGKLDFPNCFHLSFSILASVAYPDSVFIQNSNMSVHDN